MPDKLTPCFDCSHPAVTTDVLLRRPYCAFHWGPRQLAMEHEERIRQSVRDEMIASAPQEQYWWQGADDAW